MRNLNKNQFLKRTLVAIALSSALFGTTTYAAIKPFESEKTKQINGFQPIIPSIGAAITKKNQTIPYAAKSNSDVKTVVEVGDTLYVPVGILQATREQYKDALKDAGIFEFKDLDNDEAYEGGKYQIQSSLTPKVGAKSMDVLVEWYAMPKNATSLEQGTVVAREVTASDFGVPYEVQPTDAGKKIGFRVTPVTVRGIPNVGVPLDVLDVSLLGGQEYPEVPEQPGVPDPETPPTNIPNNELPKVDNPNIGGGGIVQNPYAKYRVVIVNKAGEVMRNDATAKIPYVNSEYSVKIEKIMQKTDGTLDLVNDKAQYRDLTPAESAELQNNIVWQLYEGDTLVVNTGISDAAFGDTTELAELKEDATFTVLNPTDTDINTRLLNGTLTFKTQLSNDEALIKDSEEGSEQGLTLKAILVADDELYELTPSTPSTPDVAE
ncbi:hypothetical protein [Thorsellia kenyensis]|uniref:Uncharacterized protein n=1 Tax=Thorsellia kenyensis TaxID=1549888 RepID=A0ABV6C722_9GAMM